MSHIPRNLEYLNRRHIVYRRDPINDRPSMKHRDYNFYEDGTYECYQLFRSKQTSGHLTNTIVSTLPDLLTGGGILPIFQKK